MKHPILMSLFVHLAGFGILFLSSEDKIKKQTSFVSLINSQNAQNSRLKKVKGSIENQGQQDIEKSESGPKSLKSKGKDNEDVEERLSSQAQNTNPAFMTYAQELQSYIEKNQFYPRRAMIMGQEGEVQIRFKINKDGQFSNIEIDNKTQYEILNKAAFELIVSLKSFKPLPKEYKGAGEFVVPIRYHMAGQ